MPKEDSDEMGIPSYLHRNPLIAWLVARRMRTVLGYVNLAQNPTLLDFGCGVGMLLLQTNPGALKYIGVDILLPPAKDCLLAHGRNDFELIDIHDWVHGVNDGSLDVIVAQEVLEHVNDVQSVLEVFRRKLRPNGRLIVSGPTENAMYRFGRKLAGFTGEYHHRDIYDIMGDIDDADFARVRRSWLPLPGPLALFVVTEYRRESG
jgi:2-polyprenyl-3-methyl-5-hydroxy-6-metoxy-1,4-benzoquinol methylase